MGCKLGRVSRFTKQGNQGDNRQSDFGVDEGKEAATRRSARMSGGIVNCYGSKDGSGCEKDQPCPVKELLTMDDYNRVIVSTPLNKLIVIDFYADWCQPCKDMGPKYTEIAREFGSAVLFLKSNVDTNEELSNEASVNVLPTFHLIKHGRKIEEVLGSNPDKLRNAIEKNH